MQSSSVGSELPTPSSLQTFQHNFSRLLHEIEALAMKQVEQLEDRLLAATNGGGSMISLSSMLDSTMVAETGWSLASDGADSIPPDRLPGDEEHKLVLPIPHPASGRSVASRRGGPIGPIDINTPATEETDTSCAASVATDSRHVLLISDEGLSPVAASPAPPRLSDRERRKAKQHTYGSSGASRWSKGMGGMVQNMAQMLTSPSRQITEPRSPRRPSGIQAVHTRTFRMHSGWHDVDSNSMEHHRKHDGLDMVESFSSDYRLLRRSPCMLHPMSRACLLWEIMLVFVITWDFAMVPLALAFHDVDEDYDSSFIDVMSWMVRMCWTLSIPLNCSTGFVALDGGVELNRRLIILQYLRTWMLFDIVVVGSDWLEVAYFSGHLKSVGAIKLLRMLRVLRVLRLVRVFKAPSILERLHKRADFERAELFVVFIKISVVMLGLTHLIACLWFVVGRAGGGWVEYYNIEDEALGPQYTASLHWAAAQLIGNINLNAQTYGERLFAVPVLGICFFASACFVSEITASLTRLSIVSGQQGRQFALLRQYLHLHSISPSLRLRVLKAAQYQVAERQQNMPDQEVELLQLLSGPLQEDLHYEVNNPVFSRHPFFKHYDMACTVAVRRLCRSAMEQCTLVSKDIVFIEGEKQKVSRMFLVRNGRLIYSKSSDASFLGSGSWASDMALWVLWVHRGELRALATSSLLSLDAGKFMEIAGQFTHPVCYAAVYAMEVAGRLNPENLAAQGIYDVEDVCDYWGIDDVNYGRLDIEHITAKVFPQLHGRSGSDSSLPAAEQHSFTWSSHRSLGLSTMRSLGMGCSSKSVASTNGD